MNQHAMPAPDRVLHGAAIAREKVARADRIDYCSARFAPAYLRPHLIALYAFWHEVSEIIDECSEIQVARIKLGWWQEEIQRVYAQQARHPIGLALMPAVTAGKLPESAFLELIDGLIDRVGTSYVTHEAWHEQARRTRGRLALLVGRLCGDHDPATAYTFIEWGAWHALAYRLQRLGAAVRRGHADLPEEDMQRFMVSKEDLRDRRQDHAFCALMKYEIERVLEGMEQSKRRIVLQTRANLAPLFIGTALWRALLEEIQNDGYRVLSRRIELTPIRNWWIAWRAAR